MKIITNENILLQIGIELGVSLKDGCGRSVILTGITVGEDKLIYHYETVEVASKDNFSSRIDDAPINFDVRLMGITGDDGAIPGGYDIIANNIGFATFDRQPGVALLSVSSFLEETQISADVKKLYCRVEIPEAKTLPTVSNPMESHSTSKLINKLRRELEKHVSNYDYVELLVHSDWFDPDSPGSTPGGVVDPNWDEAAAEHLYAQNPLVDEIIVNEPYFTTEDGLNNLGYCAERSIGRGSSCQPIIDPHYIDTAPITKEGLLPLLYAVMYTDPVSGCMVELDKCRAYLLNFDPDKAHIKRGFIMALDPLNKTLTPMLIWIHSELFPSQRALLDYLETLLKKRPEHVNPVLH